MREPQPALPVWLRPGFLVLFVLVLTGIRLLVAANAGLAEDEAYYRLWGLSPAFGYYDHPPMIGWWIAAGQALFGDTAFAIRVVCVLSAAIGSLFLWRTADILFGRKAAGWSVLFFNATILIGVGSVIATPDAPSVFFWGLSLWALAELVRSENANWWLAIGFFAGFGLVAKYSVLFLGAGIVLWLLLMPQARRWLKSWQLWAGGILALAVFVPVIVWNAGHEWASFHKQFGRAVPEGWTLKYLGELAGALVGLLNPLIAVLAAAGAGRVISRTWAGDQKAGLVLLTTLPFLAYLVFHAFHARVQGNWPAPIFPAFVMMAALVAADPPCADAGFWRRWTATAVPLGLVVSLLVLVHAVHPLTAAFGRKDPTQQTRGWDAVANQLSEIAEREGAGWIATDRYYLNAELAFSLRGGLPVVQVNDRIRYVMQVPQPVSLVTSPALFVAPAKRDPGLERLLRRFARAEQVATVPRRVKGVTLENIVVYRVESPDKDPRDPVYPLPL
ncbi:glycosyl transferase family 39 [Stappia sp. GBMRC 2046]|uniref:Glycosyl transferase family 39 n=1 Tax=Stappia sediminis TaxID=2692190 RepID=A0A7X3LW19_9HYPH|nr:glycosyltransferase family 39 protein [Stappia sediminis]MXN66174.1 glycosyl transferase family 39 [Stappia sediminis]